MELTELAERVAAGENTEELVIAISIACNMKTPHYSPMTDLNTARGLVPADTEHTAVFWQVGNDGDGGNPADYLARVLVCSNLTSKEYRATAATPAQALCAAALRARSARNG